MEWKTKKVPQGCGLEPVHTSNSGYEIIPARVLLMTDDSLACVVQVLRLNGSVIGSVYSSVAQAKSTAEDDCHHRLDLAVRDLILRLQEEDDFKVEDFVKAVKALG